MSLGRPSRGVVDDKERLFQCLEGLYEAINAARTAITQLEQRIITVTDNSTTINLAASGDASPLAEFTGDDDNFAGFTVPGKDGSPGHDGRPGRDGLDGDEPDSPVLIPGPRGAAGAMLGPVITEVAEDQPDPFPVQPSTPTRTPFVLVLGYGPDNFDGTLPVVAEAVPHFWLHPYTSMDNVSPLGSGSSHNDMVIEWEVGGSYTFCQLDVFIRTVGLSPNTAEMDITVTKNGTDTAITAVIPDSETNTRHVSEAGAAFADGDKVGVRCVLSGDYTTGSVIMQVVVRLT